VNNMAVEFRKLGMLHEAAESFAMALHIKVQASQASDCLHVYLSVCTKHPDLRPPLPSFHFLSFDDIMDRNNDDKTTKRQNDDDDDDDGPCFE
jgi:hypothetical protein